jgi:hypothetical protein
MVFSYLIHHFIVPRMLFSIFQICPLPLLFSFLYRLSACSAAALSLAAWSAAALAAAAFIICIHRLCPPLLGALGPSWSRLLLLLL